MSQFTTVLVIFLSVLLTFVYASPYRPAQSLELHRRADPVFPNSPPSCPICAQSWPNINSCAQACPVLANFTNVIFNPGAFIDVIKCACTDTFEAAFPQCVDCFQQTNQTDVLNAPNLPSVVNGLRNVCSLASSLLGGVASTDGEIPTTTSSAAPTPTASTSAGLPFEHGTIRIGVAIAGVLLTIFSLTT